MVFSKWFIVFFTALCLVPVHLPAQGETKEEGIRWRSGTLHSAILNENLNYRVFLPEGYEKSTDRYPVLFVTPNWEPLFPYAAGVVNFLSTVKRIPAMMIVSIDCNRWRDLIPTPSAGRPGSGRADAYLDFFERELIPFIEREYRAGNERIFWSHSIGGVFSLYALCSRPAVFTSVIASSPWFPYELSEAQEKEYGQSLYAHERGYLLKHFESFMAKRKDERNFLYVSVGDEPELLPYFDELSKMLEKSAPKGLKWKTTHWPNENHQSMLMYGLEGGLLAIFADRSFQ